MDQMSLLGGVDWAAIAKIVAIDIMLGVDNAIVIALACAGLPIALRSKAIFLGTAGAVILRAVLLACAGLMFGMVAIKGIAGAYLIYIGAKLLLDNADESHEEGNATTIFAAVKTVIIADFMMSLDNVLAVVGAAQSAGAHSTWYAIGGIVLSIPIIIFCAQGIMKLMDRFPIILWVGAGMLGWVGAEMILSEPLLSSAVHAIESHGAWVHTAVKAIGFAAVILVVLLIQAMRKSSDTESTAKV
ncbi:YjbE family putative metal transport protein [Variovorax robiniae]|uniref:YjbE family putative metal transport protein n=1 Tax=Variovorax robiniae TaxID=1836199 RepID=A0ABU8XC86_9BURK